MTCIHPGILHDFAAKLVFSRASLAVLTACAVLEGSAVADDVNGLHSAIRNASDVNFDGIDDLLVASRSDWKPATVWAISGRDGSLLWSATGRRAGDGFGCSMDALGDVDLDGVPDVVIGAGRVDGWVEVENADGEQEGPLLAENSLSPVATLRAYGMNRALQNYALVLSGRDGHRIREIVGGSSVARAGDVDNDGVQDVLVGSAAGAGFARAYSGFDGRALFDLTGEACPRAAVGFGTSVVGVGDVDEDGFDDVAVGAAGEIIGIDVQTPGCVVLLSSRHQRVIASVSGKEDERLGWSLARAGDLDRDGVGDLLAGSCNWSVRMLSGKDMHELGQVWSRANGGYYDAFAASLDGAHDIDGDGCPDFVVGANETNMFPSLLPDAGYATVYSGRTRAVIQALSDAPTSGVDACALGDVDGDHTADLAILLEPKTDLDLHGHPNRAEVRIVAGRTNCLIRSIDLDAFRSSRKAGDRPPIESR